MKQTNTRFRHFEKGRTMEVLQDRAWKEENEEFGYQEIIPQDDSQVGLDYQTMEFEFDDIETTIRLRAKAEITGSTGLTLWTCAQILSGYLLENPHHVKNKRILELGAGLGLCSQIAYHLGAANVLATDGDLDVLRNLRFNMKQNQFSNNQTNVSKVSCPQLIWGEDLNDFEDMYEKQSVIMATDVFYSRHLVDPLWRTVDRLLEADGIFLLSFCPHNVSIRFVLDKAREMGFTWSCPNICENGGDNDEHEYVPSSSSFGYYIFVFHRKQ